MDWHIEYMMTLRETKPFEANELFRLNVLEKMKDETNLSKEQNSKPKKVKK